ncbi:MAG: UbiD family decarboxylase [Candidatus Latescibacterota bacterium]
MTLREFICRLEQEGRLRRFAAPVDWKHEIGRLTRQADCALLFENVRGYPGQSVFTNGLRTYAQIALALGLPSSAGPRQSAQAVRRALARPLPPVQVSSGPVCSHVVEQGIDLERFPVPWWSELDGGRYVGTWHLNITRSPDTGERNVGVYRMQVKGPATTALSVSSGSHIARHIAQAEKRGTDLEMAVAIGVPESLVMVAGAALPYGTDELAVGGALEGSPVELVPCRTVDLLVPATAEIVLEGRVKAGERVPDGPYLDYAGFPSADPQARLFEVTGLMFRDRPVFRGTSVGPAGAEDHRLFSVLARAGLVDFHGNRLRQSAQNKLLCRGLFRTFQLAGKAGRLLR